MNTATRLYTNKVLLPESHLTAEQTIVFPVPNLHVLVLLFVVLLSAITLIYVKDLNRRLFIESQKMQNTYAQLQTEQEKLLLEQSAWSTQARVQQIAEQNLEMQMPGANSIVMIKAT
jgi:cell division protein FtsL